MQPRVDRQRLTFVLLPLTVGDLIAHR